MIKTTISSAHPKWMCKYHIGLRPKYKRKEIEGQIKTDIGLILREPCNYYGLGVIEGHLMIDHVHVPVNIPPKMSVSSFMGYFKR